MSTLRSQFTAREFTRKRKKWTSTILDVAHGASQLMKEVLVEVRTTTHQVVQKDVKPFARELQTEWRVLSGEVHNDKGWIGDSANTIREFATSAPAHAKSVVQRELKPFARELQTEWRAFAAEIHNDEGWIGDSASAIRDFAGHVPEHARKLAAQTELPQTVMVIWGRAKERTRHLEDRYQVFAQRRLGDLLGAKRRQHASDLASDSGDLEIPPQHRFINRYLAWSMVFLGTSIASAIAPVLLIVTVPFCFVIVAPVYKYAYLDMKAKKQLTLSAVEAVIATLVFVAGAYVVFALSLVMFFFIRKVSILTQESVRSKLTDVFGQHPRTVWILENGLEVEVPFERILPGSSVMVHAGQMIPVDGIVRAGLASVDQHQLTGEAQPVEKAVGEQVFATTVMLGGRLEIEVQKAGDATLAGEINQILQHTTEYNLAAAQKSLALSEKMILPTFGVSLLAWPFLGGVRALALLSGAPGAHLMQAAPLTLLHFLNAAAQESILVKDGRALELLETVDTVVFDKTGTLTLEQPELSRIHVCGDFLEDELLAAAAAAEFHQSHPIARAILEAADSRKLSLPSIDFSKYDIGYGIQVQLSGSVSEISRGLNDAVVRVGSSRFMDMHGIHVPEEIAALQARSRLEGFSVVMVAVNEKLAGAIELIPKARPEASQTVAALRERGLSVCIISGDQEGPTRKLADELGIDNYFFNILPQEKASLVKALQEEGKVVCFVGDGINDAIALKQAEVSISLRGATTVATDTAKVVLMDRNLAKLPILFDLAHEMQANLKTGFTLSVTGGVAVMGSVLFLHAGLVTALLSSRVILAMVIGNALLPRMRHKDRSSLGNLDGGLNATPVTQSHSGQEDQME